MIDLEVLEKEIKLGKIENSYVFCGLDEELIKEGIELIVKSSVDESMIDLNYIKLDGVNVTFEDILNACETMPFFGEKKVVLVYRAEFLKDKTDASLTKLYKEIEKYLKDLPNHTTLIMYNLFNDKRETPKKNSKLKNLEKITKIVYCDKLKKDKYYKKIEDIFKEKGKEIGKVEVRYFAEKVQNNFDVIKREAEKIICYCGEKVITKGDIDKLIAKSSEDDVFDLIELISIRKAEKSIDLLNELLFKNDQHMLIITNIVNNFKRLYEFKMLKDKGYNINDFTNKFRLPPFICEKILNQSNKFTQKQLQRILILCLETENNLKSSNIDKKMELELMLFNIFMIK